MFTNQFDIPPCGHAIVLARMSICAEWAATITSGRGVPLCNLGMFDVSEYGHTHRPFIRATGTAPNPSVT